MLTAIIVVASIAQIVLSLFVLFRSNNNLSNRLFFLIGVSTLGWALADYFSTIYISSSSAVYFARAVLFFVVLQNAFFYMFARTFPKSSWEHSKKWLAAYWASALLVALATISPFIFRSVTYVDGKAVTDVGPLILLFMFQVGLSTLIIFKELIGKEKKAEGALKQQLQILIFASFLLWIVVPITNLGITQLTGTTIFTKFAPVYTVIFTGIIAYAIISQKLFDIRAAVARSVAYLLSIGLIGLIYGGFVYLASTLLIENLNDNYVRAFYILFALVSAVLFQPLKNYFDRLSNQIFYRDAYDPQRFLDDLNKSLVTDIEIGILLRHTAKVIEENLRSSFCIFGVHETEMDPVRIIGTQESKITKEIFLNIHKHILDYGGKEFVTDELVEDSRLKKVLLKNNVAVVIALQVGNKDDSTTIAYLMLGSKKSGNTYSKQDLRIIDIIADELVIAIQNALRFEEIQGFAITLQAKVNEATTKLKKTNEKLKDLDETKDEFISMASHQLRTPLTSVKGYLSMVLEGDAGKLTVMQQELLNQAFVSSQRMVYLIADLLNVSRLKTGKFIIDSHPTDLSEVVEGEITQLKEVARSKKLTLIYEKPKDFPILQLDETKIRQVIMNFADNAIYYTPSGGKIVIELKDDKSNVYFMVRDDGLGVPKEEQSHLFTKFYRAKNARQARPDGTGLGLFMAKKVINTQGGNILFESKEGKGSTFGFTFKKAALAVSDKSEDIK